MATEAAWPLDPAKTLAGPVMVASGTGFAVRFVGAADALQPEALVTVRFSVTLPDRPAA